ncbi:MAG: hypothetical protein NZT92_22265 [Abditibacteriales bacterium]|nr:hypothetical protein [Abditibacteriales bacterium]
MTGRRNLANWASWRLRGLSLVSATVALLLLATTMTLAITALASSLRAVRYAKELTLASHLADAEMERLRAQPFAALKNVKEQPLHPVGLRQLPNGQATLTIEELPPLRLKKITVTVRWQNPNAPPHQARLVTLAGEFR